MKKLCSFFSQFFFHVKVSCLFQTCEKLDKKCIVAAEKEKYLLAVFLQVKTKNCYLDCQQITRINTDFMAFLA